MRTRYQQNLNDSSWAAKYNWDCRAQRRIGVLQSRPLLVLVLAGGLGAYAFNSFLWMQPALLNRSARSASATNAFQRNSSTSTASELRIRSWRYADELDGELAQLETVFWEPEDTKSMRAWLAEGERVEGLQVLEIGSGTGLVSLVCRRLGAARVVATDINPAAVACTRYNAEHLGLDAIEVRLVSPDRPGPFEVIGDDERFDLIVDHSAD